MKNDELFSLKYLTMVVKYLNGWEQQELGIQELADVATTNFESSVS